MLAFIEELCTHTGIVRAGPCAKQFGDPYDYAVVYRIEGETAHIKALISDGNLSFAHYKAMSAILAGRGLKPKWQRMKRNDAMSDERYSGEVTATVKNLTTGAEETFELKRVGDMSRAGLAQWIAIVAPIGPAIDKLNAKFLADDLA